MVERHAAAGRADLVDGNYAPSPSARRPPTVTSVTGSPEIQGVALPETAQPQPGERGPEPSPPRRGRASSGTQRAPGLVPRGPQRPDADPRDVRRPPRALRVDRDPRLPPGALQPARGPRAGRRSSRRSASSTASSRSGTTPRPATPFSSVGALFDVYLARNVPSREEGLVTFVDGEFYRAALSQFPLDRLPSEELADWEGRSRREARRGGERRRPLRHRPRRAHFRARRVRLGRQHRRPDRHHPPRRRARPHRRPPDLRRRRGASASSSSRPRSPG